MPTYKIKAKDAHSNLIAETLEAETQRDVIDTLHRRGLTVIRIEELHPKGRASRYRGRIKLDELVVFSRQLATMVNAGLPLIDGLRTLYEQIEHYAFRQVISGVVSSIEGGSSFTDAIARYPKVFGAFFTNMVFAGEASGKLAEILTRVADYFENINSLRRKIRMAMIYPIMVSVMAVLITIVLLVKVIPVFEGIFSDFGASLPLPTKVLIAVSKWFRNWFLVIVAITILGLVLLGRFRKTERGRVIYDRFKFRVPIFGDLFRKVAISRFSRTFGTLVESGVPILNALEIVKEVSGNKLVEGAVANAEERIREGKSIEEPLRQSGVFPPMVTKMISVGEKSGKLEEMLDKISVYYDDQVTTLIGGLTNLIEPLLIAFLGVVVGGIVFCMFLPIFRLSAIVGA